MDGCGYAGSVVRCRKGVLERMENVRMKNLNHLQYKNLIYLFAVVVYLFTAINSNGYHHADEHYQILEFAGLKLGKQSPDSLAWEFKAQIRPTLQATIAYLVIRGASELGVENPHNQAMLLRIITALLALFSISFFVRRTQHFFKTEQQKLIYLALSYFLWFLPYISVRFSSETWSGLFFLLALAIFFKERKSSHLQFIYVGLVFGLSFLFRFQIAFAIIGFGLWSLVIDKEKVLNLLLMLLAFLSILSLGCMIDSWFYEEFVFAPWNYFCSNIIDDVASSFGTAPFYYYFARTLFEPNVFIGLAVAAALFVLLLKKGSSIFIWIIVPYLFFHSIVPHKEYRFLFPLVYLLAPVLLLAYNLSKGLFLSKTRKVLFYGYCTLVITINIFALCVIVNLPAGNGSIEVINYIHKYYDKQCLNNIYTTNSNPYVLCDVLPTVFYMNKCNHN